jgi:hypothetical protein
MTRWTRLAAEQRKRLTNLHLSAVRAVNADEGVRKMEEMALGGAITDAVLNSYREEQCSARLAHIEARAAYEAGEQALRMHTRNMCIQVMFLVIARDGTQRVIERRSKPAADVANGVYPDEFDGDWHNLSDPDDARPMTFDEAIGRDDGHAGDEFIRLYTADNVDVILDRFEGVIE